MGEAGVKVRVRCVRPWPLSLILCPLLGVLVACVGLAWVGPWVRVDSGGGSPRPWEKQGLRLGLGVLAPGP